MARGERPTRKTGWGRRVMGDFLFGMIVVPIILILLFNAVD
jgi:hypothetical protein